ncbi:ABC transporter permease [Parasegetibacter sp. NRK P23]|uniref:ABC transporter permease n=1 Tax=Parasegetibacter sp. NRK P23 TaxID=2942999 RepID=UPI00204458ED|nr:ABC transporter permease [Parasegetibacter sp. NRK P23]MCM5529576.1 ABC transporter permease [Parasegetibacter sp. NRK P23]
MWQILQLELFKIFRRPRTYISFAAIAAIIFLVLLAFYVDGKNYIGFALQSLTASFDIDGKVLNGYLICFIILQALLVHVPLLIALVAGDMIAGEANMGTLRLLLTKPVSRTQLLMGKFAATLVYTILLLVWMALLALVVPILVFGTGDLLNLKSDQAIILERADILWRYIAAFGFAAIAMSMVASLAFFLSLFAENSIGPIVATMSIIIVCTILSSLDIPIFTALRPYLFTTHMLGWKGFFDDPVHYPAVLRSAGVLLLHIVLLFGATVYIFKRKDILS